VLGRFFGNSREQLLLSLLGDEEISAEEIQRMKDAIRDAGPDPLGKDSGSDARRKA
jgi:hypothetical protein